MQDLFQFPSNGKVESKSEKRSAHGKPPLCFNSLQTGKWSQSYLKEDLDDLFSDLFQFPSNGKGESKQL